MSIGRSLGYSLYRQIEKDQRRKGVYRRLQSEAASRPESLRVPTPVGDVWMSPIEHKLYEAMLREGLSPIPQFCIQGYYVDFAFPDTQLAVEADGAAFHGEDRREHDRKRDWIIGRAGWTVKRFHGSTIHQRAANCAYVIKREVETRRMRAAALAREAELRREARREALLRPFRILAGLLTRAARRLASSRTKTASSPPPKMPK